MRAFFFAAICLAALVRAAEAKHASPGCPFDDMATVTLKGVARSINAGAEEPGESINTYFYLETSGPPCGSLRVLVFATGIIPCIEEDKATVRGVFYKPSKPPFDFAMIDLATVSCTVP